MPNNETLHKARTVFERHVPSQAVELCLNLYTQYPFTFIIKKPRLGKLGDYRHTFSSNRHTITINNDLGKYSFLITYIHEVAHLITTLKHGRKAEPHGKEWKHYYGQLILQSVKTNCFPPDLELELLQFAQSPKASTAASKNLTLALKKIEGSPHIITLSEINVGEKFIFKGLEYLKLEKKRTRSLCLNTQNNNRYLIPEVVEVKR